MAQKLNPKEVVNTEELAKSNMFQIETKLRIPVKKGIMIKQEYLDWMMG